MVPSGDASSPCGTLTSWPAQNSSLAHDLAMQSPPIINSPNSTQYSNFGFSAAQPCVGVSDGDFRGIFGGYFHPNMASLSPPARCDIGGASLARSISADAAAPPQAASRLYSGISGHSSRVERSNLDDLRRRAEQLYRDQQAVIGEMSEEWLKEKAEMSQLVHGLRERVQRLEGENTVLKSISFHNARMAGLVSPQNSIQSGSLGGFHDSGSKSPSPQGPPGRNANETSAAFFLPPGLDGASRRPHFVRPGGSPCVSPNGAPLGGHTGFLSPRTEPQRAASTDFLLSSSSPESNGDVPVIDVQEIDPKLEGIPIKATAVQKTTFEPEAVQPVVRDANAKAARVSSPPEMGFHQAKRKGVWGAWEREKLRNDRRRCGLAPLTISKDQEQAKNILAADESRRLTMHAGHTPNHSLSLFPTMTATEGSSTAARSQETTPKAWPSDEQHDETDRDYVTDDEAQQSDVPVGDNLGKQTDGVVDGDVEGYLEPADDVPLRGPLMIKNIPAQDEVFWAQVNQRLDPISRGKDALPKVLQPQDVDAPQPLKCAISLRPEDEKALEESNTALESDDEAGAGKAAVEPDVPLKFKATCNFGAPFGTTA